MEQMSLFDMEESAIQFDVTKKLQVVKSKFLEAQSVSWQDLFEGFDTRPQVTINWSSSTQVVELVKLLGFNTSVEDKTTGKKKDSVVEKHLAKQKGVDDKFLELYFNYQEAAKECSTYGENYINAINPITGRIHTSFKQLGASSGRMSCGGNQQDYDLAKAKQLSSSKCKSVQIGPA